MCILLVIFLPFLQGLGDSDWNYRETNNNILLSCRPFSDPILYLGLKSENPEIYIKSLRLLNSGWFSEIQFNLNTYFSLKEIIYTDYEDQFGLPWLPDEIYNNFSRKKYIKALSYILKEEYKLDWYIYEDLDDEYRGYGLNDLRFYIRGLNYPSSYKFNIEIEMENWKHLKKTWRNK